MDAFLRRVVELRELEQEVAILAVPVESFLRNCRVCGRHISGDSSKPCRVCVQCGGARVDARLKDEDNALAARAAHRAELLRLAGFHPQQQERLMSDRKCKKCEKPLRSNNQHDTCHACRLSGAVEPTGDEAPPSTERKPKAKRDALKRFKVVASALGVDPDALIAAFCEGWLDRVKSSANFGNPDA